MSQPVSKPTKTDIINGSSNTNCNNTYSELMEWNQKELQHWLEQTPFTVEDIRKYYDDNNRNNNSMDESQDTSQYYFSSDGETTTEEAQLAIRLLTLSPTLAKLRFRMVPAKISESSFWEAVIGLLKERLFYQQEKHQIELEQNGSLSQNNNGNHHKDDAALRMTVASKNREIASLQRQVKELQQKLLQQQQHTEKDTIQEAPVGLQQKKHNGKWIMNQDSIDFLSYPPEVKTNMRQEKQRRLQQIQNEMKFILDSDHEKDSQGRWNCCNVTEYQASCAKCS